MTMANDSFSWPEVDMVRLANQRRERITELLAGQGLDLLLLSSFDNIRFATDFRTSLTFDSGLDWYSMLVDGNAEATLIAPDVSEEERMPFAEFPWIVRRLPGPSWQSFWAHAAIYADVIAAALKTQEVRRIEVDYMDFHVIDEIQERLPGLEIVSVGDALLRMRRVKSADELTLIEAAAAAGSLAVDEAMARAEAGMSDLDIVRMATERALSFGVETVSHAVLVANRSAHDTNWYARGIELKKSSTFFIDFGVYGLGGYCHDFCRTGHIGDPKPAVAEAHLKLSQALDRGVADSGPGTYCSEITSIINQTLSESGLPPTGYAMGHGIGLRLVEPPAFPIGQSPLEDSALEAGMVICVEPSTHVVSDGITLQIKEEEMYVVESNGLRQITSDSRVKLTEGY